MDSIDDRTHGAEEYVKRWEPQEGSPKDDVIDALVEAFQDPEMRKGVVWANGKPVFPLKKQAKIETLKKSILVIGS